MIIFEDYSLLIQINLLLFMVRSFNVVIRLVRKRDEAECIRDSLLSDGFGATVYHGSLPV